MKPRKIGTKEGVQTKAAELPNYAQLINTIAGKTEAQVEEWVELNFSRLNEQERTALKTLAKAIWALSKLTKKQWKKNEGVDLE